ncbi:MAG: class I SAM-dependent methyltransferase [Gimesia sp.]
MKQHSHSFNAYHPVLSKILTQDSYTGRSGKKHSSAANSTIGNLHIIHDFLENEKPQNTMEIGMAFAMSSLVFSRYHERNHSSKNSLPACPAHTAIDPFQTTHWDSIGLTHIEQAGLEDYVTLLQDYSCVALPNLLQDKKQYDFIYVDGSHIFEDVFIDFYYSGRLLNENGIILFDDSTDKHVFKVIQFIKKNMHEHFQQIDLSNYGLNPGKKLRYSLAQRLGKTQATAFRKIGSGMRDWNATFVNY